MAHLQDLLDTIDKIVSAKIGSSTGYTEIEPNGTTVAKGTAIVYDDQQIQLSGALNHPTKNPSWILYKGSQVIQFDPGVEQEITFVTQLSHKRVDGSDIDFHIHSIAPNISTGNIKWRLTYSWANKDEVFPLETTVSLVTPAGDTADKHSYLDIATLDGTGKNISSILLCSLTRLGNDVEDTSPDNVYLIGADFHMQIDMLGSREELVK